jgi:ubiquinone/menaquinone biosynthesis C-methylase UbiE
MKKKIIDDSWGSGIAYERFMGRWSSVVAKKFLSWMDIPPACNWLDVGCGTGSLIKLILERNQPKKIIGIDSSTDLIRHAQRSIIDPLVQFKISRAESLNVDSNSIDAVVSGLALNFVLQPEAAVSEMLRVTKSGGKIGVFLWDYEKGMQMLRYFWNAAIELDNNARKFDEGSRFPLCKKENLEFLFREIGFKQIESATIDVRTIFHSFDDYWQPFLCKVGPAPAYLMSLDYENQEKLKMLLLRKLPIRNDGSILLSARAWAVKCTV